ncbi:MAG TPA: 16S rRNA (cytidine(1402)-2'-O)-methyltransferase [Thermomicrobiales bacterium]|jgi:16S rRNA (cytidine1402-2'-O)-methyltransferase
MGILYVVATPIGNLEDISARALRVLREVSLIAAEDTRHTGRLLAHFGIETPLLSYHAFNERARRDRLLEALATGDVALVSDAGTPAISDPGQALVAAALAAGHTVSPIPGPSSLAAAVSASGLVAGPFTFLGFLPRAQSERRRLVARAAATGFALVLFEAPGRVASTVNELRQTLGGRQAAILRELTKLHEDIRRGTLSDLSASLTGETLRGEVVIVIAGGADEDERAEDPKTVVSRFLAGGMKPSEAAREAAAITGRPRSELYELARAVGRAEQTGVSPVETPVSGDASGYSAKSPGPSGRSRARKNPG